MSNLETLPVIAGTVITTDDQGRFNLNALHKASGLGKQKQPSNWLRLSATKELVEQLQKVDPQIRGSVISVVKGGKEQGSFAHELLAVSYAGWISPAFQLKVNQTFIDYRNGRKQAVPAVSPLVVEDQSFTDMLRDYNTQLEQLKPILEFKKRDPEMFKEAAAIIGMKTGVGFNQELLESRSSLPVPFRMKPRSSAALSHRDIQSAVFELMLSHIAGEYDEWTIADVVHAALGLDARSLSEQQTNAVRACFIQLGWRQTQTRNYRGEGKHAERVVWKRPSNDSL